MGAIHPSPRDEILSSNLPQDKTLSIPSEDSLSEQPSNTTPPYVNGEGGNTLVSA